MTAKKTTTAATKPVVKPEGETKPSEIPKATETEKAPNGSENEGAKDNTQVGASAENPNPSETDKEKASEKPASETKPSDVEAEFKKAAEVIEEKAVAGNTGLGDGIKHYRITNKSIHAMQLLMLGETVPARKDGVAGTIDLAISDKDIVKVNRALAQRNAVIRTIAFHIEVIAG